MTTPGCDPGRRPGRQRPGASPVPPLRPGTAETSAHPATGAGGCEVTEPMTDTVIIGNASDDGAGQTRGWFVGHFLPPSTTLRRTDAVEVKWGVHPAGESRPSMAKGTAATTLSMLVSGAFRVIFPEHEVRLARPGDYVLFPPGLAHGWTADRDSIIVTVRWPSSPGDGVEIVADACPIPERGEPAP
jgi:hypothetical protein